MSDPTAIDIESSDTSTDPRVRRMVGTTAHGYKRFNVPFITEVAENLWHGGVERGLVLPDFIEHVVTLYPWEHYLVGHELQSRTLVKMYDATDQGFEQIDALAEWVNVCRQTGPVLVHCQAGLNRSSLVVAKALILAGEVADGDAAIALLREKRSPAVLCNPAFEAWVRNHSAEKAAA